MSGAEDSIEAVECLRAIYYETAQGTGVPEEDLINTVRHGRLTVT